MPSLLRFLTVIGIIFGVGYGVLNIARPDLLARYSARRLFAA